MDYHPVQGALWLSEARFVVNPAGRRSGKTELAKRKIVLAALMGTKYTTPRYFAAAPTRDQAKRIYWADLKAMIPTDYILDRPSESELLIRLVNGAEIQVIGLDKPQRIEGSPWDGGVLDEYADMKPMAWEANVRPALSDRQGWCHFIGVPEGRNHYYDLYRFAQAEQADKGAESEWEAYHWVSADILPAAEIESAKRSLDPLVYAQEYEADFVTFQGRAYYAFEDSIHTGRLHYDSRDDLVFAFDFNISPYTVAVLQEKGNDTDGFTGTGVIGEVYIPRNGNTLNACARLIQDWGDHQGRIMVYGDATGGAQGTAKVEGSDWELIERELYAHFGSQRVYMRVPRHNPPERSRVNALNTRLLNGAGDVGLRVDPAKAPNVIRDLEGVRVLEGGSGELDKKADKTLTHISDALGYYVVEEFPIEGERTGSMDIRDIGLR